MGQAITYGARNGLTAAALVDQVRLSLAEISDAPDDIGWPLHDAADKWDFAPIQFAIEQLLPLLGVIWWGGLPKRGKSLLMLYICLAIACRRPDVMKRFKVLGFPKILYVSRAGQGAGPGSAAVSGIAGDGSRVNADRRIGTIPAYLLIPCWDFPDRVGVADLVKWITNRWLGMQAAAQNGGR